jgi:hypothetical protein
MRVGVDLKHRAAIVYWASLHISARKRLWAENRDPNIVELIQGVQLTGRILRPSQPGESYDDVLRTKIVILIDGRFYDHVEYLERHFEVHELPQNLS